MNALIYKRIRARRMRLIKRLALSAIFLAAAFAVAEHASAGEDIKLSISGPYHLYQDKDDGYCHVSALFDNDTVGLGFVFTQNSFIYDSIPVILVKDIDWKLSAGKYAVSFEIDSLGEQTSETAIIEDNDNFFAFGISFETLTQISQGKLLKIRAGTWTRVFPLKGTSVILKELAKCSSNRLGVEASNPFENQTVKDAVNPFVDL